MQGGKVSSEILLPCIQICLFSYTDKQLQPGHELGEKEHVHSEPDGKETLIDGRPTDYIPRPRDMERV